MEGMLAAARYILLMGKMVDIVRPRSERVGKRKEQMTLGGRDEEIIKLSNDTALYA